MYDIGSTDDTVKRSAAVKVAIGALIGGLTAGGAGGTLGGIETGKKAERLDREKLPASILRGESPIPVINKHELAKIVAADPTALDKLKEAKQWIAEVEALAIKERQQQDTKWQDTLKAPVSSKAVKNSVRGQ